MTEPIPKALVGIQRMGKGTKAQRICADKPRVLYVDPMGHDFNDGVIFESLPELGRFWERVCQGPFRIVWRPTKGRRNLDFPRICAQCWDVGDMTLVIEEADLFCRHGFCLDEEFEELVTKGAGHAGVEVICCTQSPARLAQLIRSQMREWFCFHLHEEDQVQRMVKTMGPPVTPELIRGLARYEYIHYRLHGKDDLPDVHKCKDDLTTGLVHSEPLTHASPSETEIHEHDATQ